MTSADKPGSFSAPDICIYHSPCADGFAAAWAVWKRWPDVRFIPAAYGDAPLDVDGKHVLIVDFSYKLPVLQAMGESAASITILDHHKSAEADLRPFAVSELLQPDTIADLGGYAAKLPVQALFDMTRSGAMMAWTYCHGDANAPLLIQYVQDRDLWHFDLHFSREIAASLFSHDYDFRVWDEFSAALETDDGFRTIVAEGSAIERKHRKDVDELLGLTCRYMVIGGQRVPVANIPYTMASDAANQLAEGNAFAACYYDNADGRRVFSLRSKPKGADVSAIATAYGGGGHARAAGFSMPGGWEGDETAASVAVGAMLRHHDGRTGTFVSTEEDGRYRVQSLKGKGFWIFHADDCRQVRSGHAPTEQQVAVLDIAAERRRQIESEGRSAELDDRNTAAELAKAAAAYVTSASGFTSAAAFMWPSSWSASWWKPTTPRRDLVKAGALIVAEIERLDRATQKGEGAA